MRLLDLVAQGLTQPARAADGRALPGAERFRQAVCDCPIRFVLADELAHCAMQMAYSDGDRLTSCLDLIRVPARTMWVEWMDDARAIGTLRIGADARHDASSARRAGVLITAAAGGRSGEMRTFWSTTGDLACCSPIAARFDLDGLPSHDASADPVAGCGWARVIAPEEYGLDDLLDHLSFHFDDAWATYYRQACPTQAMRGDVLHDNLRACAFDPPMLFAFLLMLCARGSLPRLTVEVDRLNRARVRRGRPPMLEHVLVSAPLSVSAATHASEHPSSARRAPRLHHVCGHLVRRGAAVFWRGPHLRGSARLGQVRTRTVELSFAGATRNV